MGISDKIEAFICQLIEDDNQWVELGRNELANIFGCVPSQINYVISTRFTPERGYIVESRRGGGGYIKIKRRLGYEELFEQLPDEIDAQNAKNTIVFLNQKDVLQNDYAKLIISAVCETEIDNKTRAKMMKNMIKTALDF